MILAIVRNSNGDDSPWMGHNIYEIMEDIAKAGWVDNDDYLFGQIKWFELGESFTVTRETVYRTTGTTGE